MNERHKIIYARLSRIGFPLVCAIAAYLGATRAQDRDRLYWETPSIPFQPFCDEGGNWGAIRPIRGVKMSERFVKEVVKSLSQEGAAMYVAYYKNEGSVSAPNPHPLLITPKLFKDSNWMLWTTQDAVNAVNGTTWVAVENNGKTILQAGLPVYCKDVEGKVKEF